MKHAVSIAVYCLAFGLATEAFGFSFVVDSKKGWQPTTLNVTTGQALSFAAQGLWTVDTRTFSRVGSNGYGPQEDALIFQGCKLDASLPYGQLLVRIGDDPDFQVLGDGGTVVAPRGGQVAFRIHDNDACLGDNDGTMMVTVAEAGATADTIPFFYCITSNPSPPKKGQVDICQRPPLKPSPDVSSPPAWLTSPKAIECLSDIVTDVAIIASFHSPAAAIRIADALGPMGSLVDWKGAHDKYIAIAPQLAALEPTHPLFWLIVAQAAAEELCDTVILKSCSDWWLELETQGATR